MGPLPLLPPPAIAPPWLPPALAAALQPTGPAFLVILCYAAFYVALDAMAGLSWAMFTGVPLAWSATWVSGGGLAPPGVPHAAWWALGVFVFGW